MKELKEEKKKYIRFGHSTDQGEQDGLIQFLRDSPCFGSDNFHELSSMVQQEKKIRGRIEANHEEINKLRKLFGAEQFNQMVHVLQALGYVDSNFLPTPKLNMARKLMAGPELLLLCEVFYANLFNVSLLLRCLWSSNL